MFDYTIINFQFEIRPKSSNKDYLINEFNFTFWFPILSANT